MNNNLRTQLKQLQQIKPDAVWKRQQREVLLRQADSASQQVTGIPAYTMYIKEMFTRELALLTRPAMSFALVAILVVSGGLFSITAASEITPGSFLYTAKIVGEKTQFGLAYRQQDKVKLGVKFAERRASEIQGLVSDNDHANIESVAETLASEIESVKDRFVALENDNPQVALELARDIDTKTNELSTSLKAAKSALSASAIATTQQLDRAIRSVEDTGLRALNTIIATTQEASADLNSEASDRVATKLAETKEQINSINYDSEAVFSAGQGKDNAGIELYVQPRKEIKNRTNAAAEIIIEAEELLSDDNYQEALNKINESQQLLNEAVEVVDEGKKAIIEQQSSTTPEVKGVIERDTELDNIVE